VTNEPTPPESNDVLLARCLRGDQLAYQALFDLYAASLYRLCYNLLLNRDDAEDIAQDAFVYAFKNLHRYDPTKSAFRTWLFTIAISRCRNVYRRNRPPLLDLANLWQGTPSAPDDESPEAAYAQRSAREALEGALMRLTPSLREAVVLRYGHGLTYREIADVMDCPPKTAESRVRLAHEALRGLLHKADGEALLAELLSY
jgi:RNA polymerase sigma-70 factor (ECF subfamily)